MRRWLKGFLYCALVLAVAGTGAWFLAPWCVEDPLPLLEARRPAKIYTDCNGVLLYAQRGEDAQWRFPVTLGAVHPEVLRAICIAEDAHFYEHSGVDYKAALRALVQNLTSRRILSGASTISMQVSSLATGRQRTLWAKFLQAARARKMERLHTKDEILAAYLNHLPFGGKIYGIEAAAQYYFGLSARDLTFAEATFLCGIPQRPNAFRPDRHPEVARQRQKRLLAMMVRRGVLTPTEADACYATAPIRLRDFRQPATFQRISQPNEHLHALLAGYPIDATLQQQTLTRLRRACATVKGVRDAACVIVWKGELKVYLGTLDFQSPHGGQVDAARAQRSAGSILKPFIFAEAIEGGLIVPETKVLDAPVRYGDYTPTNYDTQQYHGELSAAEALAFSLNTPVIRLLATLGEARVVQRLATLGLAPANESGLTLALGTGGATLLQLVRAYAQLEAAFSPGTAQLIAKMLRRPLPNCGYDVAWKTGTANNNTDAWCVGWTPEGIVGVWFGNKDGTRSEALVGAELAAPVVGELFTLLYEHHPPPRWDEPQKTADLCALSGLTATTSCSSTQSGVVHPTLPLKRCERCLSATTTLQILSPIPRTYYGSEVTLPLRTNQTAVRWLLNGSPVEATDAVTLTPGRYTLHAIAPSGETQRSTVVIVPREE